MTTGFALSEKMMPVIKTAIGRIPSRYFFDIEDATFEKDTQEATDLIIKLSGGDVAVRVRGYKYSYPDGKPLAFDLSIRWRSRYGLKTEIDKLREGFGRWYFFAIAHPNEDGLCDGCLIDLNKMRSSGILQDEKLWQINPNTDGTAGGYIAARKLQNLGCVLWPEIKA
jgi:hypothetical protein